MLPGLSSLSLRLASMFLSSSYVRTSFVAVRSFALVIPVCAPHRFLLPGWCDEMGCLESKIPFFFCVPRFRVSYWFAPSSCADDTRLEGYNGIGLSLRKSLVRRKPFIAEHDTPYGHTCWVLSVLVLIAFADGFFLILNV